MTRTTVKRPTLEDTLQNALDVAITLTRAEKGSVFLLSADGVVTHSILGRGALATCQRQAIVGQVMDQGLAGWVFRHRQIGLISDTTQDERWVNLPDDPQPARSVLAVPIFSGENVTGILTLVHSQPDFFDDEDAKLMQAAADQMALAVRNAQMFDELRHMADRQVTLYEVLRAVSGQLDPLSVAQAAVGAIVEFAGWLHVGIALPSEDALEWRFAAGGGLFSSVVGIAFPMEQGITGQAFWGAQTRNVPDVRLEPTYINIDPSIRSLLLVPLERGGRVLGVLDLVSQELAAFDSEDVELAESLADVLALALDNASLYAETHRYATDLSALYAVTRTTGQSLRLEDVLLQALSSIIATLHFEAGVISLFDVDPGDDSGRLPVLHMAAQRGMPPSQLGCLECDMLANTLCAYVYEHRESLIVGDLEQKVQPPLRQPADKLLEMGWRAYAGVPLLHQGQSLGIMNLFARQPRLTMASDTSLFTNIGQQVAAAVLNARLFQTTQKERSRLHAVITSSRDGIVFIGMDRYIHVVNQPAVHLLRLPGAPEAWLNRPLSQVLSLLRHTAPRAVKTCLAEMRRTQKGDESPNEGEYDVSPYTIHWLTLPVVVGDAPMGRLVMLRDVTEDRAVERLREDMTHTMVHDLRNPLSGIVTSLQLLTHGVLGKVQPEQLDVLKVAEHSAGRMRELVSAILDVSQLESGRMPVQCEAFLLPDLVAETLQMLASLAQDKDIRLESDVPATLPPVWADKGLIRRVLQNLVGNALKFTPRAGRVAVMARLMDGGKLAVSVSDSGSGIPPAIQGRLFQKFVAGRQEGRGSGLGLAFCKLALEAHGERIEVQSDPGRGATFTFTLAPVEEHSGK